MAGKLPYSASLAGARPPAGGKAPPELNSVDLKLTATPDEPRRSDRATKGQHKNLDMVADAPGKKSKAKKDKQAKPSNEPTPDDDQEEIIRCICGEYEEEEDVERDMICCDQCLAWQHNDCMGLVFPKGEEPDQYYCEQCRPANHKELLDRMARGEKPWEEVAERRRQEAEALKASRRKKGKKGKKSSRPSVPKSEVQVEVGRPTPSAASPSSPQPASSATPGQEGRNGHVSAEPASNQKRKLSESAQPEAVSFAILPHPACSLTHIQGPKVKQQKTTSPAHSDKGRKGSRAKEDSHRSPSQGPVAETLEEISNPGRRNAANALVKLFVDQFSAAQKQGSLHLPDGKSTEEVARRLGISIEHALYLNICGGAGEPTEQYKLQLRTILFNVKKNTSLRDRLFVGSLLPDALAKMSSQDMASEELQQKDAEIKRESERQHVIIQEQGPRIRRTHKGEELVEDDHHNVNESVFSSGAARRSVADTDGSPHAPTSPAVQQPPSERPGEPAKQHATDKADEKIEPRGQSPDGAHDAVFPEVATHIREPLPSAKVQADDEIDNLLRDDEPDSPPYSPKDFHDEGVLWRGKLAVSGVAEFSSSAKLAGGADLTKFVPWSELAPSTLMVDGRIDIQLASNYLCGLRFSSSTEVTVMAINSPQVPAVRAGFDKLFNYFQERKRYGVISKHPVPAVTDTYVVPVEAGTAKKPEFMDLLENSILEDSRPERLLLVVFVVKLGDSNRPSAQPGSHQPSQEPTTSPVTGAASTPQQGQSMSQPAWAGSQNPGEATLAHGVYSQPQQPHPSQPTAPFQQQPPNAPITGMAAAIQVLGPQANTPAVQQLVQQAPSGDVAQMTLVRDALQHRPEAASNFEILMQALYQERANGNQQNAG